MPSDANPSVAEAKYINNLTRYISRFFSRVRVNGDCWLWTGSGGKSGVFSVSGGKMLARKASLLMEGYDLCSQCKVDNTCGNDLCVRPDHLYISGRRRNSRYPEIFDGMKHALLTGEDNVWPEAYDDPECNYH